MRGITLTEDFVTQIVGKPAVKISESQEGGEQTEKHVCPLCESHLEAPISDDQLSEHIDLMIDIIDEMSQITEGEDAEDDGEELAEDADADDELDQVAEASHKGKNMPAFLKQGKSSKASPSTKGPKMGK